MENLRIVFYPNPTDKSGQSDKYKMVVYPSRQSKGGYIQTGLISDERFSESLSRSKRLVRDLAFCNEWDYFCTFTFNDKVVDRYSYNECKKALTKFFNNYRNRKSKDFRYLIIPELHSDGAIHFHGLVKGIVDLEVPPTVLAKDKKSGDLIEVPNSKGYFRWSSYKLGYFNCSRIVSHERVCSYLVKYLNKDVCKHFIKIPNIQLVLHSQGLKTPVAVYDLELDYWNVSNLIKDTLSNKARLLKFEFCDLYQDLTFNDFVNVMGLFNGTEDKKV